MVILVQSFVEHPTPTTVRMVGAIVQWASSLLLIGVFALLIPLQSQRRAVVTWMTAWIAEVIVTNRLAVSSLYSLAWYHTSRPAWIGILDSFAWWPARFVFLIALALGAVGAAGWRVPVRTHYRLLGSAVILGLLVLVTDAGALATQVYLVATVILVFGAAQ